MGHLASCSLLVPQKKATGKEELGRVLSDVFYQWVSRAGYVMLVAAYLCDLMGNTFGPDNFVTIGRILFIIACCDFLIALFAAPRQGLGKANLIADVLAIVVSIVACFFVYLPVASIPLWAAIGELRSRGKLRNETAALPVTR